MSTIERAMKRLSSSGPIEQAQQSVSDDLNRPLANGASGSENSSLFDAESDPPVVKIRAWARQHGMDFDAFQRQRIIEEYRHIKRPLIINIGGGGTIQSKIANRIMVTSSLPGEGKTFTALNLAISMAGERDRHVVLIDTDMSRSPIPGLFGLNEDVGLIDFLDGKTDQLDSIMLDTDIASLKLIPAGQSHRFFTELLFGKSMECLLQKLNERFPNCIIMFDSSPLLVSSEATALVQLIGQVLFVVKAGVTKKQDLREAIDMLDASKISGYVLNYLMPNEQGVRYSSYVYSA